MSTADPPAGRKILIIGERFYPEEFLINDLAVEWTKMGKTVGVLTQNPSYPFGKVYAGYKNRLFRKDSYSGITIYRFFTLEGYKSSRILKIMNYLLFPFLGTFIALCTGRKYDSVFIYQTGPLTQAIPGIILGRIYRKPVFIWTWDLWPDTVYAYGFKKSALLRIFLDGLVRFVYKNSDTIFISSPGFRKVIEKYSAENARIIYAPNWVPAFTNLDVIRAKESTTFNFLFAGNIGKVQNLENVIRGFHKAFGNSQAFVFHIVGDGSSLPELELLASTEQVTNVVFHGRKPAGEMHWYYAEADVLVISLMPDPLFDLYIPSKFQSYLAVGKPVLCCMEGVVKQMVNDSDIGLAADPGDIDAIAKAFTLFSLLPEEEMNRMKNNTRTLLDENFDRSKIIAMLTETISNEK